MRFRITIARLLAAIAFIGVSLAALRSATDWGTSAVFSATLLGFALAAAYAVQRRGPRRAFWASFVTFGVGYLVLTFGPWCETTIRPRLLTTRLLALTYPWLTPANAVRPSPNLDATGRLWGPDYHHHARFQTIGHSLSALLLAAIGGTASGYFHANRDERRREAAEKAAGVLVRVLEAGL